MNLYVANCNNYGIKEQPRINIDIDDINEQKKTDN